LHTLVKAEIDTFDRNIKKEGFLSCPNSKKIKVKMAHRGIVKYRTGEITLNRPI
jgi:hypothetical protein